MSRGLTTRLRKLEARAGRGGNFAALARRMPDDELFEHSKAVSEALVISYGGLDEALSALMAEEGQASADFVRTSLECTTAAEFIGYANGWEQFGHGQLNMPHA